ncbi:APC family permease [Sandarakinorhabdus sp.]|uniref:APC family permease n=1 Tax=Sandarakinorhabdus sp. TaxID=1916663 RepID=UPI003F6FEA52
MLQQVAEHDRAARLAAVLSPGAVMLLVLSAASPVLSVFVGGSGMLHLSGTLTALAFLLGGIIAALFALLYAELGVRQPGAGGIYPGLARLIGPGVAHGYMFMTILTALPLIAFTALGLAGYIRVLGPALPTIPVALISLALAAGIAMLNIRTSALVTGLFLGVELLALAILSWVAVTAPKVPLLPLLLPANIDWTSFGIAVLGGLFWTGGANYMLYFAEEVDGGRAALGPLTARAGVICAVTIAGPMLLLVPALAVTPALLDTETPIAAFLDVQASPAVAQAVSAGVIAAVFNAQIATIMAFARMIYAMGRDRVLPGALGRLAATVSPRTQAPWGATLLLTLASAAAIGLGERWLLILTSGNVADYLLVAIALLLARQRGEPALWKAPAHPLIPGLALLFTLGAVQSFWSDTETGRPSLLLIGGTFALAWGAWHMRRAAGLAPLLNRGDW